MHDIHHSEAFVLDRYHIKEHDGMIVLFTKELGVIHAQATGVLKHSAKLRSHLQPYSFIKVDLVRGRQVWRLTNARLIENPCFTEKSPLLKLYIQYLHGITRFYVGEEPHAELFSHAKVLLFHVRAEQETTLSLEDIATVSLFKLFYYLGYIEHTDEDGVYLQEGIVSPHDNRNISSLALRVRNALKTTQL
jgi:recombinational DNA repair protein (RecF pathway)